MTTTTGHPPSIAGQTKTTRIYDQVAIAVLAVATIAVFLVFRDYGLGWDDYTHSQYGDLLLAFYSSSFADRRALSFVNLYMYGGGYDLAAAIAAKILPIGLFETRRLLGGIVGILGLLLTWRIGRRTGGPLAGLLALVLLATCPLYDGHAFMNAKDAPFALAMALLLLGLVRAFEQYPQPAWTTRLLVGAGFGLSIGSRVMGGFGVVDALAVLAMIATIETRKSGPHFAARRLGAFVLSMLPAVLLAYAVMALVWPWSVADPLNPLRAVEYFSHFFEKPWRELFAGTLTPVPDMPRSYVPTLLALKLPEIFVLLASGGAAWALVAALRSDLAPNRRAVLLLILLAALLPVAVTIAVRPAMYNGIRHFVFVLPPFAVVSGLAAAWILQRVEHSRVSAAVAAAVFTIGIALPVTGMARLHPYEYTYFNSFVGGVAGARPRYMLDYWGLSLKQASQGLRAKLAQAQEQRPEGPRWKLAVCGPHRSPQVELGPDFETTWDPRGADFAMMLGEFYCAKLDAPIMVEIAREGVVYARVYDIRGRSFTTLLTVPPP